jgi:hypothetical protein
MNAENNTYEYIGNCKDTMLQDLKFNASFLHQHQDFFNKAFSYQGIEAGVIINNNLMLNANYLLFVSSLEVMGNNMPKFIHISKAGFSVGNIYSPHKLIHSGWLINLGYFSLTSDSVDCPIFEENDSRIKVSGLVFTPEVFAELNVLKWMKFRTGLGYSFYSFTEKEYLTQTKLQNFTINFAFIFGKFD